MYPGYDVSCAQSVYSPKLPYVLRPCLFGYSDDGVLLKTLYCSYSGQFFKQTKDGYRKLKVNYTPAARTRKKGHGYPMMCNYGAKLCHLMIANAWIGPRPDGYQCDHLNSNVKDCCAGNLQWVTRAENCRRAKRMRAMRRIALDPKHITYAHILKICMLSDEQFSKFLDDFMKATAQDTRPITIQTINDNVELAL